VILNDDGANPHSFEHSLPRPTRAHLPDAFGEYGRRAVANPTGIGALHLDKITTAASAFRSARERSVGSIGVSGSPGIRARLPDRGGDADAACAQAGIDHVAAKLK